METPDDQSAPSDASEDVHKAQVREHLRGASYDCIFHETTYRRLSSFLAMRPSLLERAMRRLEEHEEREAEFKCEESARLNFYTFICWCMRKQPNELQKLNEETLGKYPNNIAALTFKLRLMLEGENPFETDSILDHIRQLSCDSGENIEVAICEAEIARAYHVLGQQFYFEALERYEKVTRLFEGAVIKEKIPTLEIADCCHFRLAQTYNRMMSATYRSLLHSKGIDSEVAFERISYHLTAVINSESKKFAARSMVELVEAYERCKQADKSNMSRIQFPYPTEDLNLYIEDALNKGRDEPYVLEHCGKYYRHHASRKDEKALKHAIAILDECTRLSKTKHVAWHQKGHIYLVLSQNARNNSNLASATNSTVTVQSRETWRQQKTSDMGRQKNAKILAKSFSLQAVDCFKQACDITHHSRCMYLVDLAKLQAQLGLKEANRTYEKADALSTKTDHVDDGDLFYLYSRWAYTVQKQLEYHHDDDDDDEGYTMDDMMTMCRKALRSALIANTEHKYIAESFKQLLQSLEEKNQIEFTNGTVAQEFSIIRQVWKAFSNQGSSNHRSLINQIQCDDVLEADIHQLIHSVKHDLASKPISYNDANTVYLYLTALAKAGKLNRSCPNCLQVSLDAARQIGQHDKYPGFFNRVLRDVFRWYIRDFPCGVRASERGHDGRLEDDFDTCVVTCTENNTEETQLVMEILQDHLGLFVGRLTPNIIKYEASNTQSTAINRFTSALVVNQRKHEDWPFMVSEIKRMRETSAATAIYIVSASSIEVESNQPEASLQTDQWPQIILDVSKPREELTISLLESMISLKLCENRE